MDLIVRNALLPDGQGPLDVAVAGGRIAAVGPGLDARAPVEIDAAGRLLSPPFVDAHFHLDAVLSHGQPRTNVSGTLLEGIALWSELKPLLTPQAVMDRALAYCDWAVARGLLAIRAHVDVCDDRLVGVEALLEVRRRVAPYLDLQLVAFPQDGLFRAPNAVANLTLPLLSGNAAWAAQMNVTNSTFLPTLAEAQAPPVVWIGCADSRVPESVITNQLPGQIFTTVSVAHARVGWG